MRSPSTLMRSLKDKFIETLIVTPYDRGLEKSARKRKEYHARLRAEACAAWNTRLPGIRHEPEDAFDLCSTADVSTQQQSPFFAKLPLELRRLIYTYAMGGEDLQLELYGQDDKQLQRQMCEDNDDEIPFTLSCIQAQRLLGFPASCKIA
jgi:hypothetical protein